jgi:hypothetical protein
MGGWNGNAARSAAIAALAVALLLTCGSLAQATTYYSSPIATDPTSLESWWTYPDGTGANPADFAGGDMFVVQANHVLATTDSWVLSGTGCALWIQPGAVLTVGDGAANRLELIGSTFQIDPGATYVHDSTADWDSTCFKPSVTKNFSATGTVILRATDPSPGTDIAWGNLTVDLATSPGADWNWEGHLTRVNGDLTVRNTGGYEMRLASDSSCTLDIVGDLVINGGDLQLGSGAGSTALNIAGDFTMTAGAFGSSGTGIHTVAFWGGAEPRTFTRSGGTLATANVNWQVDTETLVLASAFAFPAERTFTVASSGTLVLAAPLTNAGTLQANGTLQLGTGGSLSGPVSYGGNGTLVYAGGDMTAGPEWGPADASAPLHVAIAAGAGSRITLAGDRTVYETLALTSGTLVTGADTLTLGLACTVTGAGAGSYVHGNLARVIPATLAAPVVFDVGDSTTYAPIEVAFDTVGVTGTLTASTAVPDGAPAVGWPPTGSGISPSLYARRSWTLANSGAFPVGFGRYTATFHFVAADVVAGAEPLLFIVARDSSGTWSHPAMGEPVETTTTATGLTGFGRFYAGELGPLWYELTAMAVGAGTVTKSPDQGSYVVGSTVQLTATAAPGWTFMRWGGDVAGRESPLTVTVDRELNITAVFAPADVVVSQVYGGGGGEGAAFANDFVELYNRGVLAVDVMGWTVQVAAAGDSTWTAVALDGTIPAGGYYLVQLAAGPFGGASLPAPDASGEIPMGTEAGKVALVCVGTPLAGVCPADTSILDLVGYGGADCAEGAPAGALSGITAALRNADGCDDTDDNLLDFSILAPVPRNSLSPVHYCSEWVGVDPALVTALQLAPVAPNPTRGGARVSFALPAEAGVRLRVVDLQGRVVATLVDGVVPAGLHEARWDGTGPGGAARPGLYFVRLEAGGKQAVRSVILVR